MRVIRSILAAALLATLAISAGPAHAARSESKRYVGADTISTCLGSGDPGPGGACFQPLITDTHVAAVVADDVWGQRVRFGVVFLDAASNIIARAGACDAGPHTLPGGTHFVLVEAYNTGGLFAERCIGSSGVATAGTITVTFSGSRPPPATRTDTQVYVAGTGSYVNCGLIDGGPNVGGGCFVPLPGETRVTISGDGIGIDQPITVRFVTTGGNIDRQYCNTTGLQAIPAGTTRIVVWASPFSGPLYSCPGLFAYPLTGTITAVFS